MKITIYRGTKEIGGTLVELKMPDSRILIDAGYPLFLNGKAIDNKIEKMTREKLLALGVLPNVEGLYSWDQPSFSAVLISHAHLDHYGLLKYIHPNIPIYMSEGTQSLIRLSQLFKIVENFELTIRSFEMYNAFKVGDFSITPYLMDHSAFDSAAFEITAADKTVIYTGDFRGHGRKAKCLDKFLERATKQADILLIEGTMLGRQAEQVMTESELEEATVLELNDFTGPVLFQASGQNIDRLVSFYRASIKLQRIFVIDIYTANVLSKLRQLGSQIPYPSKDYPNIRVFYPWGLTKKIFDEIGEKYARDFAPFRISREEIKNNQRKILMMVGPSLKRDLKNCYLHDGIFIYSLWQGYRECEYQQKFEKSLEDTGFKMKFLHTSGHAVKEDLTRTIKGLDPKKVIPIHTLEPELYLKISNRVELHDDGIEFDV